MELKGRAPLKHLVFYRQGNCVPGSLNDVSRAPRSAHEKGGREPQLPILSSGLILLSTFFMNILVTDFISVVSAKFLEEIRNGFFFFTPPVISR